MPTKQYFKELAPLIVYMSKLVEGFTNLCTALPNRNIILLSFYLHIYSEYHNVCQRHYSVITLTFRWLPPSSSKCVPVVKLDSLLARKAIALATSSGCPTLPIGNTQAALFKN